MYLREFFAKPEFLWLLIVVPILGLWYYFKNKAQHSHIIFSGFEGMNLTKKTFKYRLLHIQNILRLLAITFVIIALAQPQTSFSNRNVKVEGIDIMLSMDISGSMLAEDFKPNRIEAAKKVAEEFIDKRPNDRIGLVAYSGVAFTQCPLTIDHVVLKTLLKKLRNNMVIDGTAIGDGLGLAVERLRHSDAISKVIILLTDGINNMGSIDPRTAAEIAKEFSIRVYTIGVGTIGKAPYPINTPFGKQYQQVDVEIDETLLKYIAETTGGKYFRAKDNKSLQSIYDEIDKLEKTKIEVAMFTHKTDYFHIPLLIAFSLIFIELLIKYLILKKIP